MHPTYVLIGQTVVEIRRFNGFHEPSAILLKISVIKADRFMRPSLHYRSNFCQDRSVRCYNILQFIDFFVLLAVAILDLQKF